MAQTTVGIPRPVCRIPHPVSRIPCPASRVREAVMAIRGSLKEASLPDVLQLLAMGKRTGCLSVTHRNNFGYIYFDKGKISYASIVNRRDRIGDMLVKAELITHEQLQAAIDAQAKQRDKRIGDLLI